MGTWKSRNVGSQKSKFSKSKFILKRNIKLLVSPSPGPSWAQARFLEIWKSETWKFGIQQNQKNKIIKIKIRSAQNVGKVWISRKQILPAPFGAIPGHFFHGPEKSKKCTKFAYFPWWAHPATKSGKCYTKFLAWLKE